MQDHCNPTAPRVAGTRACRDCLGAGRRSTSTCVEAEHTRLQAIDGVKTGDIMGGEGPVSRMFAIEDPDGNHIWVVQST